jgi:hypothetical protein
MKIDHRHFEPQLRAIARPVPARSGRRAHLGLVLVALLAAALTVAAGVTSHPLPRHATTSFSA